MNLKLKQGFRNFNTLNKSEQNGIIILSVLVLGLFVINWLLPGFFQHKSTDLKPYQTEIESFHRKQQQISDSLTIEYLQNRGELDLNSARQKLKPFIFNPNNLPDESWKKMGFTEKQIRVIKNYEAKGGRFYRKEDVKKIYSISESEYQVIMPYIRIPSDFMTLNNDIIDLDQPVRKKKEIKKAGFIITEINSSDPSMFVKNLKLPSWLAVRIVKYRNLLGGFYQTGQLAEVYGFDSNRLIKLKNYLVVDPSLIKTIDMNTARAKTIAHHPYFSYQIAKEIVNRRLEKGKFTNKQQLVNEGIVTESLFLRIRHYITME